MSFDEYRCIFVHIPKCCGVSVSQSLFGKQPYGHTTLETYQMIFDAIDFQSYFKFTVVRNPWDRLVSAFTFLKRGGMTEEDRKWASENLAEHEDFESFVGRWLNRGNVASFPHFRPQCDFIRTSRKAIGVDFIAYYENLAPDFAYICKKLDIQRELLHLNVAAPGVKKDYKQYYTAAMRRKVAEVYANDIRLLKYSFDNSSLSMQIRSRFENV